MKIKASALLLTCLGIFLLCGSPARAQQNIDPNGYNILYYPTGRISSEGTMRDGQPDGYWKTYYPSGVLKSEGNRKNHLLDSVWIFYDEKGDTLQKINYLLGRKNGYTITYNTGEKDDPINLGKVMSRELYVNDRKEGFSYYYYNNGVLREIVEYKANKKHGTATEYSLNGTVITIQQFSNGVLTDRQKINRYDAGNLKQGLWQEYSSSGRVSREMYYKDGELNGQYKEYDSLGNVRLVLSYRDGNLATETDTSSFDVEVRNEYDQDGNVVFSGTYKTGIPVGIHRRFDSLGNVSGAWIYNERGTRIGEGIITMEGKKEGEWTYFNENGSVKAKGHYTGNLETGHWIYYSEAGKKEQTGEYRNGKFEGLWTWFYDNGSVKREEEFYNGKEEGNYTEYDEAGNVIAGGKYYDGEREGEWFYKVNDYIEKGSYLGGLRDGKWVALFANEKIRYEGVYIQGNPDGLHKFYFENGKVKEEQFFVSGLREKNWKKYDENGDLVLTITYKNDSEVRINGEKINFERQDIRLIR